MAKVERAVALSDPPAPHGGQRSTAATASVSARWSADQRDNDFLITLNVPPETDIDLEIWAAERLSEMFRQVYNKPTTIVRI